MLAVLPALALFGHLPIWWIYLVTFINSTLTVGFQGCTGYLVHPFKTRHIETEKDLLRLLANTGGLVYHPKSSTAYSCSNDDTLT